MKNKNIFYTAILYIYIIYLALKYYGLFISSSAASSLLVKTQDIDIFINLLSTPDIPLINFFSIKNIIYTFISAISNNGFFAYTWTSFAIYTLCIVLVYKLANFQKNNNLTGLIAVLILTTLPNMMLSVFGINVHISEGMCILFIIFFYFKSISFTNKRYSILYLLFAIAAFTERTSAPIHIALIIFLTSLFGIKNKKYNFILYNTIILTIILMFFIHGKNNSYFIAKVNHWLIYISLLDFFTLLKLPFSSMHIFYKDLLFNLSLPYTVLLISAGLSRIIFLKKYNDGFNNKTTADFINLMLLIIFSLYFVTIVPDTTSTSIGALYLDTAKFESIFPIFALTAIIIANFLYRYQKAIPYNCLIIIFILTGIFSNINFNIPAFKEREKNHILQKTMYADTYTDIALVLATAQDKKEIRNFLFVLEADLTPYKDIKRDVYKKLPKWIAKNTEKTLSKQHYELKFFMHHLNDMVLLNGLTSVFIEHGEPIEITKHLNIPQENIYNVLTCFEDKKPIAVTIKHLKTFSFTLENKEVKLHMYSM